MNGQSLFSVRSGFLLLPVLTVILLFAKWNIVKTILPMRLLFNVTRSSCTCEGAELAKQLPNVSFNHLQKRRSEEYRQHQARTKNDLGQIILAPANCPLQYPIHGFTVTPKTKHVIPGLTLHAEKRKQYKVSLRAQRGKLSVNNDTDDVQVEGQDQQTLTISSTNLEHLNHLLSKVEYVSTFYHVKTHDAVHQRNVTSAFDPSVKEQWAADMGSARGEVLGDVDFTFEDHVAVFPVTIQRPVVPVLYDPGDDINSQVTIVTKTFLRYTELKILIASIRISYPDIKIIIADDSPTPEKVTGDNIEQYIMPPAQGWFAGRNLAVSQVTSKYFLWVDDDFVFLNQTRIESFVKVMEAVPELDVLGGNVDGNNFFFKLAYEEGDEDEGGCMRRLHNQWHSSVPGFKDCYFVDGVVNFFMARTDAVRRVGFDPFLKRVAHTEFFIDGLGILLVASCKGLTVGHQKRVVRPEYRKFRTQTRAAEKEKMAHHFFKNHLKCIRY